MCKYINKKDIECPLKSVSTNYCQKHDIYKDIDPQVLNTSSTFCSRCGFRRFESCINCSIQHSKYKNKVNNAKTKCGCIQQNDKQCPNFTLPTEFYCRKHDHYKIYGTPEELNKLPRCSTCKNYFKDNVEYLTCDKCRNRGKENRQNEIKNETCSFIKPNDKQCTHGSLDGMTLCKKHHNIDERRKNIPQGNVECKKCINNFPIKSFVDFHNKPTEYCQDCLQKRRTKENNLRNKKIETNKKLLTESTQLCTTCLEIRNKTDFVGVSGQPVVSCSNCRLNNCVMDEKRKNMILTKIV